MTFMPASTACRPDERAGSSPNQLGLSGCRPTISCVFLLTHDLHSVSLRLRSCPKFSGNTLQTKHTFQSRDGWFTIQGSPAFDSVLSAYPVERLKQSRIPPGGAPGLAKAGSLSGPLPATASHPTSMGSTHPYFSPAGSFDPPPPGDPQRAGMNPCKEPPLLRKSYPPLHVSPGGGLSGARE